MSEGGLGTIFLGSSSIPVKKLEVVMNDEVKNGWQVVFQVLEYKRFLLYWKRETVILTLGK